MKHGWFLLLGIVLFLSTGCNQNSKLFQKVEFSISDNLEVATVKLIFTKKMKLEYASFINVRDYGQLFINPYSETHPFEVGFQLNTSIVNEQDYVNLAPTLYLPNGLPTGIPHAVVEVRAEDSLNSHFDVYAYVDVLKQSWLGVSSIFSFVSNKYFPPELDVGHVFKRDENGNPAIMAHVFGPTLNLDGSLKRPGGIALMANVKALIGKNLKPGKKSYRPEQVPVLSGRSAEYYKNNLSELYSLQERFISEANKE